MLAELQYAKQLWNADGRVHHVCVLGDRLRIVAHGGGVELSVRFDLNEDEKEGQHLFRFFLFSLSLFLFRANGRISSPAERERRTIAFLF